MNDNNDTFAITEITHCWKEIGVWGDAAPTCPQLKDVIHCRNCEVFTQAGRNLLEQDLPEQYRQQWTQVLSVKKTSTPANTHSLLLFRIEDEWLALPSLLFVEVVESGKLHRLPHRNNPVLIGLVNVHGEVQLCVSLKALLGIADAEQPLQQQQQLSKRMLVITQNNAHWVFPVDEIHGTQRIHPEQMGNAPVSVGKTGVGFSRGIFAWNEQHVALLDEELLFYKLIRSVQ
ncbi:chemotaxis protein CheW [Candidatus Venteria ishoeyi]|uniref:Chemotaxis protein CheW n=1 Tax=Candidatus Venteria ishoeyi TaxID=1899563 RepID=A0A1H6FIL9_9GAMM|nr:chemotaxis protein CheW [Candidatus Venteria ishoeyi]MDM8546762.1 chemotaxis protein CheW [Candidatus Venteria ishoeyi]SEH09132.1 CheW-like domain protein [Candidatus Venteria ishoeyi]SEH09261.1 CheW-like domain protein [Candidatus Venteria ishoeyi]